MSELSVPIERIENIIYVMRGQRVMLDADLALIYGVETKAFNRAIDRNTDRFPEDFAFYLTNEEWKNLKCQIGTSSLWGGRRKLPRVFTELGAYAAAFALRSDRAKKMSIEVIRAFVRMRRILASNEQFAGALHELRSFVLKKFHKTDHEFSNLWKPLEKLINPPTNTSRIGFDLGPYQ